MDPSVPMLRTPLPARTLDVPVPPVTVAPHCVHDEGSDAWSAA